MNGGKTKAYTYEAFFASDGRSKKTGVAAASSSTAAEVTAAEQPPTKAKYTCSECGKHYATSSNLSRYDNGHFLAVSYFLEMDLKQCFLLLIFVKRG